jgi:CheY-like chemotaxis protein/HAMP domain-containing protein
MSTLSTGIKWIIASLFIESIMLMLLIGSNLNQLTTTLHDQTQQRLNENAISLQSALSAPLAQMDYATVEAIMKETVDLQGITYLVVLDLNQKQIANVGWPKATPFPPAEKSAFSEASLADARFDTRVSLSMLGNPLGTLMLGLSTQFYIDARHEALVRSVSIALIELLLSAALLLGINRWLNKKFSQIAQQAQAIANGNYAQRLDTGNQHDYDQLTSAFNRMAEAVETRIGALDKANRVKSEFLSSISHELRTPLNAILGFAQMLDLESLNTEQRDQVHQIHNAGVHLLSLVNQILEINEREHHALTMTQHSVKTEESLVHHTPQPSHFKTVSVLLVEDNVINQIVATKLLQKLGITPVIANNGQEAIDALAKASFDLVLLDIQMPVMDGYQTITHIRQHEINIERHQHVIGLSANALDSDREKALQLGMDDYLTKPIDFNLLQKTLARFFPEN